MAVSKNISTKLVLEFIDSTTEKKSRFTFPYLKKEITNNQIFMLGNSINQLQSEAYKNLYRIEESEIY